MVIQNEDPGLNIVIRKITETPDSTLSLLTVDGLDCCFVLEDGPRAIKVPGKTRIPGGVYHLGLRKQSPMATRYDARFKHINHAGMIVIRDIPGFEHVYIHVGNTIRDTAGCPLVGTGAVMRGGVLTVTGSAVAYQELYPALLAAIQSGDTVMLEVIR